MNTLTEEQKAVWTALKKCTFEELQIRIYADCDPIAFHNASMKLIAEGKSTKEFWSYIFFEPCIRQCCEDNGWTLEEYNEASKHGN